MTKMTLGLVVFASAASLALAGTEYTGKEMRQTTAPEECFYGDNELEVSLWGTYIFAGTDQGHIGAPGFFFASEMSSLMDFTGSEGVTTSSIGEMASTVIGVKSLIGS